MNLQDRSELINDLPLKEVYLLMEECRARLQRELWRRNPPNPSCLIPDDWSSTVDTFTKHHSVSEFEQMDADIERP
jgi:hypothetical protein